ncbi:hypothetical protein Tco_1024157 [Tanacetum coccineum]
MHHYNVPVQVKTLKIQAGVQGTLYNSSITTGLDLLFGPCTMNFFTDGAYRVQQSSSPTDNSVLQDTHPSTNIQPTSEPSTPTNAHAEENNVDQVEFTNPFCTPC